MFRATSRPAIWETSEDTQRPVSEVAECCGYTTAEGMRLAFDRHLGVSPRDYRRRFASSTVM